MGQCGTQNNPESRKIFDSFNSLYYENKYIFSINNYDDNCQKILSSSKNYFEKLGQMQQLRVDFIQEIREDINAVNEIDNYYNKNEYLQNDYGYRNYNYMPIVNNYKSNNINETDKKIYYIIIMTLTLKSYLKRKYASNELEQTLLELSAILLKKNYNNIDLKLILYHLSKMFEILFKFFVNIQGYININDYISKINIVTDNYNILSEEEKYPFILTHIISLGEYFHKDYKNILINNDNQSSLIRYYIYSIIKNHDFILTNYSTYKNITLKNNNMNNFNNNIILSSQYYNKNDLIEEDKFSENVIKKKQEFDDLNKIFLSINNFLLLCSQDTFMGNNIFQEFDYQLDLGIKQNNLFNDFDKNKFKVTCFMILFNNFNPEDNNSIIFLSFFQNLCDHRKFEILNNSIYYDKLISLYDKYNNSKIFIDKYSSILSKIFIMEIEDNRRDNLIIDKLYNYIYNLKYANKRLYKNNEIQMNYENFYFFVNLIKNISFYYKKLKNIRIAYDILIYLTNFIKKIRNLIKREENNNNNNNNINIQIYKNFDLTLINFDYNKNDFFTSLNEAIQIPLSKFISSYIILFNDFYKIKNKYLTNNKYDFCIINTITYLEITMIKNNINKNVQIIIKLLNIYLNILFTKTLIDYEEISNYLKSSLRSLKKEIKTISNNYSLFNQSLQFTTFHLFIIYNVILIILIEIYKKSAKLSDIISKHNKILIDISNYDHFIGSHFYQKNENIRNFNLKKFRDISSHIEVFNIHKNTFLKIIEIFQKNLFNDEDGEDDSQYSIHRYRSRTLYQQDKNSDITINIKTNNNYNYYSNKVPIYLDNNFFNDSFSKNSNKNKTYVSSEVHFSNQQKYLSNIDIISENVKLPFKDNNSINYSEQNKTIDIMSDKVTFKCNLKI